MGRPADSHQGLVHTPSRHLLVPSLTLPPTLPGVPWPAELAEVLAGTVKQRDRVLDAQPCACPLLLRTRGQGGLRAQLASPTPALPRQSSPWRLTLWAPNPTPG